jgi:hypothetical protein
MALCSLVEGSSVFAAHGPREGLSGGYPRNRGSEVQEAPFSQSATSQPRRRPRDGHPRYVRRVRDRLSHERGEARSRRDSPAGQGRRTQRPWKMSSYPTASDSTCPDSQRARRQASLTSTPPMKTKEAVTAANASLSRFGEIDTIRAGPVRRCAPDDEVLGAGATLPGEVPVTLLAFATLSSTEWNVAPNGEPFAPNWFENGSPGLERKVEALAAYRHELREWPHPRSLEGVRVEARRWGMTIGLNAAEAFMLLRRVGPGW